MKDHKGSNAGKDATNLTMGDILGIKSEKDTLEKNIKEQINNQNQKVEEEQKQQSNNVQSNSESSDKLYQQLAAKYNIPLDVLDKDITQTKMKSFKEYSNDLKRKEEQENYEKSLSEPISEAQQITISKRLAKQKHISSYRQRKEVDPFLRGSFLDKQEEETPQVMRHLDNFRPFQPDINIGKRAADMITTNVTNNMKYEMALQKGKGFLWHAAKTGKLGVDLYLVIFSVVGLFAIPYYFYKVQQRRMEWWRKERGIDKSVKDFEAAGFDLDDLSIEGTFENMYKKEILEEKKKKIDMHREIKTIMDELLPNK